MKKILLSLCLVGIVSASAVSATRAYFTSQSVLGVNTLATGEIKIDGDSENYVPFTFSNLKPGDTVRKWITIKNTGTLDIDYLRLSAVNKTGDAGFLDLVVPSVMGELGPYDANRIAYFTPDWASPRTNINAWMNNADILDSSYYRTPAGKIKPGESYLMVFDFIVPTTVDSYWQGKTVNFDLKFEAEQSH